MRFLIDAQLPRCLVEELTVAGHEAVHTCDLQPLGNRTPDDAIANIAQTEKRIVVTKDSDFVTGFLLFHKPPRLLLISTGNTNNNTLLRLLNANLPALEAAFADHDFVELSTTSITIHI